MILDDSMGIYSAMAVQASRPGNAATNLRLSLPVAKLGSCGCLPSHLPMQSGQVQMKTPFVESRLLPTQSGQLQMKAPIVESKLLQSGSHVSRIQHNAPTMELALNCDAAEGIKRDDGSETASLKQPMLPSAKPCQTMESDDEACEPPDPAECRDPWISPLCSADMQASVGQQPSSIGHIGNDHKVEGAGPQCPGPKDSGNSFQLARSSSQNARRWGENRHKELYEDAYLRKQRLRYAKETTELVHEVKEQMRLEQHAEDLRQWRRLYHTRDLRTHLERENEHLRKKREKQARLQNWQHRREMDALRECTFRPDLSKGRRSMAASATATGLANNDCTSTVGPSNAAAAGSTCTDDCRGQLSPGSGSTDKFEVEIRQLVARQQSADARLRALASKDVELRDWLHTVRADLHESIQKEETEQVVAMLQVDCSGGAQQELVQRVQSMVAAGSHLEAAQNQIVEELVARSRDEALRRVEEALAPLQHEAEQSLRDQRFKILQELEAIEADAAALLNRCGSEEATRLGFEPDLAERSRTGAHVKPSEARSSLASVPSRIASPRTLQKAASAKSASSIKQEAQAAADLVRQTGPRSSRATLSTTTRNPSATGSSQFRSKSSDALRERVKAAGMVG
eukprot:CAMPEP_0172746892 /NCGR_PEP_ID=MMETSP1074-20121228/141585_1 /TAXON_ID=2916 /ORGANISM="Ceratium fusus, Strain PA161109" /LENGTH=628 /DNA_ID=CAMNT_0013578327 /DNA_START=152 /DNA_END=2038 /DNA_ORIENTATION=-